MLLLPRQSQHNLMINTKGSNLKYKFLLLIQTTGIHFPFRLSPTGGITLRTCSKYFSLSFACVRCDCVLHTLTAQPMHWIYNPDTLKEVLSDLEPCPEFRPESANPFYRRATGEQTCYGDQAYVLLESLSRCGGTYTGSSTTFSGPSRHDSIVSWSLSHQSF